MKLKWISKSISLFNPLVKQTISWNRKKNPESVQILPIVFGLISVLNRKVKQVQEVVCFRKAITPVEVGRSRKAFDQIEFA